MAITQQQIDSYLGSGFGDWAGMDRRWQIERQRFAANRNRLNLDIFSPVREQIEDDLDILDAIGADSRRGLDLIFYRRNVDKETAYQVYRLYSLALAVVTFENDMLDGLFAIGVFSYFVLFPLAALEERAQRMLDRLKELRVELKMAAIETSKAGIKLSCHLLLTAIETFTAELNMLAHLGLFVTDELSEIFLGPKEQSVEEKRRTLGIPASKFLAEGVAHLSEFDELAKKTAERSGKVATAATLYFDVKEIAEGIERINQIEEGLKAVREAYDDLQQFLTRYRVKLIEFERVLAKAEMRIGDARSNAVNTREALENDMKRYRYNPRGQMSWPVAP